MLILSMKAQGVSENRQRLSFIGDWGGRFVTAVPELRVTEAQG